METKKRVRTHRDRPMQRQEVYVTHLTHWGLIDTLITHCECTNQSKATSLSVCLSLTHTHTLTHTFPLSFVSNSLSPPSLPFFPSLPPSPSSSLFPHNASHSVFLSTGLHAVKYIFQIDHAYHSSFAAGPNPFAKWRPHQYWGMHYQGRVFFLNGGEGEYCLVCGESPWLSHRR